MNTSAQALIYNSRNLYAVLDNQAAHEAKQPIYNSRNLYAVLDLWLAGQVTWIYNSRNLYAVLDFWHSRNGFRSTTVEIYMRS